MTELSDNVVTLWTSGCCVTEGICVQGWGHGELHASTNAAAGLEEPEAQLYECMKWMLIGGPHFQPLVELLLFSSLPLFLPPFLSFLETNATFLSSVIYFVDSLSGPWMTTPPYNLSTPRGGLFTQHWLGVSWTALVTSPPLYFLVLFFLNYSVLHSYYALAPPFFS